MARSNTTTTWILELIDKVTAPMKGVDKSVGGIQKTVHKVTAALHGMDDATKATAQRAIKSFNDLNTELKQEQASIRKLQKHLKDLGTNIDPLTKAKIDFDIKQAQTKARRYKEQLTEVKHELNEIAKKPEAKKLKANWGAAVVVANQSVELINSAINGLSFATQFEDLKTVMTQMTGQTGPLLDALTAKAHRLGKVYKENPEEIAKAANTMTKQIGGTYEENLALIEAGFKKGANINGDFIDQLKEYPVFIKQLGLSQSEAIALMAQSGKDGIFSDKALDSIKEADLSLREMGQPQVDALNGIGIAVEDLAGKTTFEAVKMVTKAMDGASTQAKQLVLTDIFKGAGEDAGLAWIEGMGSVDLDINKIPSVETAGASIRGWLANLQSAFSNTFGGIGASVVELAPVITAIGAMAPIISSLTKVTWLQTAATNAWSFATRILGITIMGTPIGWIIAGVTALVAGIVWLVNNVEGWGNAWTHTWNGAKLLFSAFVQTTKANFNTMINGLMIGINTIKKGWYKFKLAMGIGDASENQKLINGINSDTEARKKSIVDGYKKAANLAINATGEFLKAGGALKLKSKQKSKASTMAVQPPSTIQPGVITPTVTNTNTATPKTIQAGASAASKNVHMELTINNHFSVNDAIAHKIDAIADKVTGRINDRLRDVMLSV